MSNPNVEVQKYGQSFWYDNIQRSIITSGELQKLIDDSGVLGITSNPAIFEKAITSSADYDEDMIRLTQQGADVNAIYEGLAIADIQSAADMLEPIYEQTNGVDGYISLEVSPLLARDEHGTVEEARRLHKAVGRRNLMIKVPATPECIPAIQTLIGDGININVTLIFSLDGYEEVARAFINGLLARAKKGQTLNIASVASFFVSRVDVLVDKLLDEKISSTEYEGQHEALKALKGKAAIANAKLAYESFEKIFSEPAFKELASKGARPQRVLWASTGTKNPAYKDTYYVENLIGKDTVNTVPPATLKAFRDHGLVAPLLHNGLSDAKRTMTELADVGVDMPAAWQKLQDDGVKLFADAFDVLMRGIESKRSAIHARGEASNAEAALGYVDEMVKLRAASRVWDRDAALWTTEPEHIKVVNNRLGWLAVADTMLAQVSDLVAYRDQKKAEGFTDAVVLGMGGSSLAPDVLRATFPPPQPSPVLTGEGAGTPPLVPTGGGWGEGIRLHVLDTTDPTTVLNLERQLDLSKTLFLVASKSGGTLEVNAFYKYFRAKVDAFAHDEAGKYFVAITDEGTSLQAMALAENFGRVFINPTDIGGRYSALSYFGVVLAALQGVDIEKLLRRASQMAGWCKANSAANPGLYLGALLGGMALHGQDKVSFIINPQISTFGGWVEQLIAESTGKQGRGIVPIEGDLSNEEGPLKANVVSLSEDRFYVHLRLAGDASAAAMGNDKFVSALKKAGLPVIEITLNDAYDIGAEFFRWEFATAIAGSVLGVDPFDEPNVTESKQNTKKLLDEFEHSGVFTSELTSKSPNGAISKHMRTAKNGDYLSLQAYLPNTPEVSAALAKMRLILRDKSGVPVTVGYGPRFLHSTGQLHKGGANTVVAVQLTYDPVDEALIPGEPFSFATLIRAQALGDFESLAAHERRVIRLHLGEDLTAGFRKILKVLNNAPARARSKGKPGRKPKAAVTETKVAKTKPAARVTKVKPSAKKTTKLTKPVAKKKTK